MKRICLSVTCLLVYIFSMTMNTCDPAFSADKKVKAWVVEQENPWGQYKVYVTAKAIRVKGSTGGSLISRDPYWNVVVYHEQDKAGRIMPLRKFLKNSGPVIDLAKANYEQKTVTIAGLKSVRCFRVVNQKLDTTLGNRMLFRNMDKQEHVKRGTVSYDADAKRLGKIQVAIWSAFLKLPKAKRFPMESYLETKDGSKKYYLKTKSQKMSLVDKSLFLCPEGLKNSRRPMYRIFGGNQLDDTAEFFFPSNN